MHAIAPLIAKEFGLLLAGEAGPLRIEIVAFTVGRAGPKKFGKRFGQLSKGVGIAIGILGRPGWAGRVLRWTPGGLLALVRIFHW